MKFLEQLNLYFASRKKLQQYLGDYSLAFEQQSDLLDVNVERILNHLEELDQTKTHFLFLEDATNEEISLVNQMLHKARKKAKWTLPEILIMNKQLKQTKR